MTTTNRKSRGIVSALRSEHMTLRAAACALVDDALEGAEGSQLRALMVAFEANHNTARAMLKERQKYTKSGRRR